ncbi:MAG: DUF1028 domain-containing protein [Xanthomonadaceae bacterium]|nr:DUF1028 domain-containing protein [Xanthomonadaceae bacterium]
MTFSVIAKCPDSGEFGVAAATAEPAVGKLLTHARAGAGAVATQAKLNPYLGIDGVRMLRAGLSADDVVETLRKQDLRAESRQFAAIDADGNTAAWTGSECLPWAGSIDGDGYSTQGNRLVGPPVLEAVAAVMERTRGQSLPDRLLAALEAGVAAGGDREGEVSATIYIVATEDYPLWDIRVDHCDDPIAELKRLHAVFREELLPEIRKMPTRANPAGAPSEHTA